MYGLRSKLVSLLAKVSVFVQAKIHLLTMKSVNYEYVMFYWRLLLCNMS